MFPKGKNFPPRSLCEQPHFRPLEYQSSSITRQESKGSLEHDGTNYTSVSVWEKSLAELGAAFKGQTAGNRRREQDIHVNPREDVGGKGEED